MHKRLALAFVLSLLAGAGGWYTWHVNTPDVTAQLRVQNKLDADFARLLCRSVGFQGLQLDSCAVGELKIHNAYRLQGRDEWEDEYELWHGQIR